jgi:hypothetical protein
VFIKQATKTRPDLVAGVIPGCPFEEPQPAEFVSDRLMYYLDSDEKQYAKQNVEKFYADPKNFRPTRNREDDTPLIPLARRV